jgi:hypothetical protein
MNERPKSPRELANEMLLNSPWLKSMLDAVQV